MVLVVHVHGAGGVLVIGLIGEVKALLVLEFWQLEISIHCHIVAWDKIISKHILSPIRMLLIAPILILWLVRQEIA